MNVRAGALLLVVGLTGLVGAFGLAPLTADAVRYPFGGAGDDDQRAVDLLERSAMAMQHTAYSGTRMLSTWGRDSATTVLVDVRHVPGQGTTMSMRGGGAAPGTATFLAWGAEGSAQAGTFGVQAFDLLTDAYAVTLGGSESVAGRPGRVVEVSRAGAVVARLWVDDRSGLLLRREVYDGRGRLVRESTFIDVDVSSPAFLAHLPPTAPQQDAHDVDVGSRQAAVADGWACPRQAGAMRLLDIEVLDRGGAMHLAYSDGLTRMSVFEQRGSLAPRAVRGLDRVRVRGETVHVREGMPTYAMWHEDGVVFTAVTDGTLASVAPVVGGDVPGSEADDGFWARVGGGLSRLGAWATPLL